MDDYFVLTCDSSSMYNYNTASGNRSQALQYSAQVPNLKTSSWIRLWKLYSLHELSYNNDDLQIRNKIRDINLAVLVKIQDQWRSAMPGVIWFSVSVNQSVIHNITKWLKLNINKYEWQFSDLVAKRSHAPICIRTWMFISGL